MLHVLTLGPDWARQIDALRLAITDDARLIGFGNGFLRRCRADGGDVHLEVRAIEPAAALPMVMRSRDLYITQIAGRPMENYAQTLLGCSSLGLHRVSAVVHDLAADRALERRFEMQSLLTFCIAEALRFAPVAHHVSFGLSTEQRALPRDADGRLIEPTLDPWVPAVRKWGQACDALWASLGPAPAGQDTTAWRRVEIDRVPSRLQGTASNLTTLKAPG